MKPEKDVEIAEKFKEDGNVAFKNKDWEQALKCYNKALKLSKTSEEKLLYFKNRAAVYLKLGKYEEAVDGKIITLLDRKS